MAKKEDKRIFSLKEDDCKAICFFDVSFLINGNPLSYSFGFHVPVILESDGLYYALCWEMDQVAYASRLENAVERMAKLLSDFSSDWLKGEGNWSILFENPMDVEYLNLFHRVKHKLNLKMASRLNSFLQNSETDVETIIEETKTYKVKSSIGIAEISQRYYVAA